MHRHVWIQHALRELIQMPLADLILYGYIHPSHIDRPGLIAFLATQLPRQPVR